MLKLGLGFIEASKDHKAKPTAADKEADLRA